ncbi:DEAD/DEAH box helicase [Methylobacterium sp. BTF04]|nr:DEAD/DEAH box helicase [Methylobacterium sp. BTF04]
MLPSRVGGLFAEMGTGKSRILIELAERRRAKIDRVVWFCPVSIKDTVRREILKHTSCEAEDIFVFDDRTDVRTLPLDRPWYVVGIESLSSSVRVIAAFNALVDERTFVAVDESTYIKGPHASRTRRVTDMSRRARYRAALTGTPFTQGVVDLYGQMTFLSPKILGYNSFWSFANSHLEYDTDRRTGKPTGRIVRSHNTGYLAAKIAPYVYQIRKSECLTLPEKLYEDHWVPASAEQRDAADEAKMDVLEGEATYDSPHIAIFRLFSRLQAIACGFHKGAPIRHNRIAGLLHVLERIPEGEKVIVWTKYRQGLDHVSDALRAAYGTDSCREFHGGLDERTRGREVDAWRREARFLVATQQSGGHGLTLTEASFAAFYSTGFKYSERAQAEDRIHRIGQERPCTYIDVAVDCGIDRRIIAAVQSKGATLASFRQELDACRKKGMREKLRALIQTL